MGLLNRAAVAAAFIGAGAPAHAGAVFDIAIDFSSGTGFSASQKQTFRTAVRIWEYLLPAYSYDTRLWGNAGLLTISARSFTDGPGGLLGSAGPTTVFAGRDTAASKDYQYAATGTMQFDTADLADMESSGNLLALIMHEMAHVIGFGTLWDRGAGYQQVYSDGSYEYTGAAALAAYRNEVDAGATFVPVEQGGGSGTADGHWDEVDGGKGTDDRLNGWTNSTDISRDLMTGWLNGNGYLSTFSLASFSDIGYETLEDYETMTLAELEEAVNSVPLPAGTVLLISALGGLGLVRRRG